MVENNNSEYENVHWADNSAQRTIDMFPNEKVYTVASGITPSGIVHVGHFREILTSELVRRALENKGKKTKFIYSWDSYDAFRKVPKNVPEDWHKYLRLPDGIVPDPWGCHDSFGEHFMQEAEKSIKLFQFPLNFQRQHLLQTSGIYADGIRKCLKSRDKIREVLDKFRTEPLKEDWFPIELYCEKCGRDTTSKSNYDEEYNLDYVCNKCGHQDRINFKEKPIVKLPWRMDWPMRWSHYHVNFEPGGKDHSSPGSSYDTGKEIVQIIFDREAPVYTFYNFVGMKGQGGKVSSSSGNGATIEDVLKVYTPELVIFLFAGTRPNAEFDISFDLDVIKIYEDFDKLEKLYYGIEEETNAKKLATLKRTYELSLVGDLKPQKNMPFQPSFRHLLSVSQSNNFELEKVKEYYKNEIKTDFDLNRLKERLECAKNWLEIYAPVDMVYTFNTKISQELSINEKKIIADVFKTLNKINDEKELFGEFKRISEEYSIEVKDFFKLMYKLLISKEKGPKLAGLMLENKEKVLNLLKQI